MGTQCSQPNKCGTWTVKMLMGQLCVGDQPEAADLGRNCEICSVELETDLPWCQQCTTGEATLWERLEQVEISSGEQTVMSILTGWSQQLPGWNLQQGLEMLLKPSNRRVPRTTQPKRAPFVVVEGIDSSGKTTHVEWHICIIR